jgi:hypothetical protein
MASDVSSAASSRVIQVQVSDDAAKRIADGLQARDLHAEACCIRVLLRDRADALALAHDLIGYSALRTKVRTREDLSEYVEAERLIGIYDGLRGDS